MDLQLSIRRGSSSIELISQCSCSWRLWWWCMLLKWFNGEGWWRRYSLSYTKRLILKVSTESIIPLYFIVNTVIWRNFLWQLWWWVQMTNENHCPVSCALSFSCVWIWCFEIFRCLFCALMTQILRTAAPRKVKWGSTIPSLGFSFCRFVITPGSLNHCL